MKHIEQFSTPNFHEPNSLFQEAISMLGQTGHWAGALKESKPKAGPCSVWQVNATSPDLDQVTALARLLSVRPMYQDEYIERLFAPFSVTVFETGQTAWNLATEKALVDGLLPAIRNKYDYLPKVSVISPEQRSSKSRLHRVEQDFEEEIQDALTSRQPIIVVVDSSHSLPDSVFRSVTNWMPLASITWPLIAHIHGSLHLEGGSPTVEQHELSFSKLGSPYEFSPKILARALRHCDFDDVIAELYENSSCKAASSNKNALSEVKGLGQSRVLLEQLAADLTSWSHQELEWSAIPQGVLLYGPPGTGKTFTASKLAEQMGVNFIATSYADWQKTGHLGDFMKAMAKSFSEARDNAPSLLFIDEIDSFGDRSTTKGDNEGYVRSAVNALLEQLDGAKKAEGVFVVAACNSFETLDPALIRSGRFDCKIPLDLPDKKAFSEILTDHVGTKVSSDTVAKVAAHLVGFSGADAAAVVRSAGSLARSAGRDLCDDDLAQAALQLAPSCSDADLRRVAIHEAGHAIVGYALGRGVPIRVELKAHGGSVVFAQTENCPTISNLDAMLCTALAGRVAEISFFGEPSAGAGGGANSDLATATRLAIQMETQFGFGTQPLLWRQIDATNLNSVLSNPKIAEPVYQRLEDAEKRTKETVLKNRNLILKLATLLLQDRQINESEMEVFFCQNQENGKNDCLNAALSA